MRGILTVVAAAALAAPAIADAQPSPGDLKIACGDIHGGNTAYQYGQYGTWLEYIVTTSRSVTTCPLSVTAAAHVANLDQSAYSDTGVFTAIARKQVLVPYPGIWQTDGRHWFTWWITVVPPIGINFEMPPTASHTLIELRLRRDREAECVAVGGEWDGLNCYVPNCPLIVDPNHDGFKLTSAAEGVLFDLDADGIPERVAWTDPDSDDAFIVMDRNGNGVVDDGTELFGNHTPVYAGTRVTAANGFDALRFTEVPAFGQSAVDGVIDRSDAVFPRLMLWRDANHNGRSEADELTPVDGSGLVAIATDYKTSKKRDRHGNEFRQRAKATWERGEYFVYDVWLQRQY